MFLKSYFVIMKKLQFFLELQFFGVCQGLGERLGFAASSIRLFFIYISFLTFGSPIFLYLSLAFVMNMRRHLRKQNTIWDV